MSRKASAVPEAETHTDEAPPISSKLMEEATSMIAENSHKADLRFDRTFLIKK